MTCDITRGRHNASFTRRLISLNGPCHSVMFDDAQCASRRHQKCKSVLLSATIFIVGIIRYYFLFFCCFLLPSISCFLPRLQCHKSISLDGGSALHINKIKQQANRRNDRCFEVRTRTDSSQGPQWNQMNEKKKKKEKKWKKRDTGNWPACMCSVYSWFVLHMFYLLHININLTQSKKKNIDGIVQCAHTHTHIQTRYNYTLCIENRFFFFFNIERIRSFVRLLFGFLDYLFFFFIFNYMELASYPSIHIYTYWRSNTKDQVVVVTAK